jgi:hypothetical protein
MVFLKFGAYNNNNTCSYSKNIANVKYFGMVVTNSKLHSRTRQEQNKNHSVHNFLSSRFESKNVNIKKI